MTHRRQICKPPPSKFTPSHTKLCIFLIKKCRMSYGSLAMNNSTQSSFTHFPLSQSTSKNSPKAVKKEMESQFLLAAPHLTAVQDSMILYAILADLLRSLLVRVKNYCFKIPFYFQYLRHLPINVVTNLSAHQAYNGWQKHHPTRSLPCFWELFY